MKIAWLTDLHLDFVGRSEVEALCKTIHDSNVDAALIIGDIATSRYLDRCLKYLAECLKMPIYFVLGNHDYYRSSIKQVNNDVSNVVNSIDNLIWLSQSGVVEINSCTCLIGHKGWADGRLGDPEDSQVELNDYVLIEELVQPTKELRLAIQHKLGDEAARFLTEQLNAAINTRQYRHIIIALHVPPFRESCWYNGNISNDDFLPHFACKSTGDVLKDAMSRHPEISMTVYCGHTHSPGFAEILPNLKVYTGEAEYYKPRIADIIKL